MKNAVNLQLRHAGGIVRNVRVKNCTTFTVLNEVQ